MKKIIIFLILLVVFGCYNIQKDNYLNENNLQEYGYEITNIECKIINYDTTISSVTIMSNNVPITTTNQIYYVILKGQDTEEFKLNLSLGEFNQYQNLYPINEIVNVQQTNIYKFDYQKKDYQYYKTDYKIIN